MNEILSSKGKASELDRNPDKELVNLKDSELLRELYCIEGRSLKQIAKLAGTTKSDVHYWMVKHGIARREWSANTPKCNPKQIYESHTGLRARPSAQSPSMPESVSPPQEIIYSAKQHCKLNLLRF